MKTILALITCAALFTSCAQGPTAIRPLVAAGTAATLQYVIKPAQRGEVARNTVAVGNLYDKFSAGHVPTPDQFRLALDQYLPNNPSKMLTETGLATLYAAYYPRFQNAVPQLQFDYLTNFLLGARDGASAFVSP